MIYHQLFILYLYLFINTWWHISISWWWIPPPNIKHPIFQNPPLTHRFILGGCLIFGGCYCLIFNNIGWFCLSIDYRFFTKKQYIDLVIQRIWCRVDSIDRSYLIIPSICISHDELGYALHCRLIVNHTCPVVI